MSEVRCTATIPFGAARPAHEQRVVLPRRRGVLAVGAAAIAGLPGAGRSQGVGKPARLGYLGPPADTAPHLLKAFQDGLREAGYVEGRTVVVDYRWTTHQGVLLDDAAMLAAARELLAGKPDLFVVSIDPAILAVKKVAGTLPMVMMNVSDPVALGLVTNLAHPGGNITGMTRLSSELVGKTLELLVELVPGARRIAMFVNAGSAASLTVGNARQAARSRRLSLQVAEIRSAADLGAAFAVLAGDGTDGLLVSGDVIFFAARERLARLALAQRLPAIFSYTENVEAGGLLAYSPSSTDNYRRAGGFVHKILNGAAPGDIPIEQPTKFELALNLNTARALGISFPQSLLLRADRIVG